MVNVVNGGLPDWLYGKAVAVRSNDERYLAYVKRWYAQIAQQVGGAAVQGWRADHRHSD